MPAPLSKGCADTLLVLAGVLVLVLALILVLVRVLVLVLVPMCKVGAGEGGVRGDVVLGTKNAYDCASAPNTIL